MEIFNTFTFKLKFYLNRFKDKMLLKRYFNLNNRYTKDNYSFWNNKIIYLKQKIFLTNMDIDQVKFKKKKKILILGDSTSESIPYIKDTKDIWTTKVENLLKK